MASKIDSTLARVQYYDSSYTGYRNIDSFGDAPTSTFSLKDAHEQARLLSVADATGRKYRVLEADGNGWVYSRGRKSRA